MVRTINENIKIFNGFLDVNNLDDNSFPKANDKVYDIQNGRKHRQLCSGWFVGDYGVRFICDVDYEKDTWKNKKIKKSQKRRKSWFACPYCGKSFVSRLDGVESGAVKSCGCRHSLTSSKNVQTMLNKRPEICYDLSILNKKFYSLTPICPTILRDDDGNVIWCCQCDCGGYKLVAKTNLVSGHVKYCDKCARSRKALQYIGKKFGKLQILGLTNKRYTNGCIICKVKCDCGTVKEMPLTFIVRKKGFVRSCGKCNFSSGEERVKNCLIDMNINFETEYIFKKCINPKTNHHLRFDFYLPDYNCCIEYDGEQHYKETTMCSDSLSDRQFRDNIKNKFCTNNGIGLVRIPYVDLDKIDTSYLREALNNVK